MTKRIMPNLAALILAQSGCHEVQDIFISGMDYSPEKMPAYDAIVGDFKYNDQNETVLFYGPDCEEPFDATSALQEMDLDQYRDKVLKEGIDEARVYARWNDEISQYNTDPAWLALNCDDFDYLATWLITESWGDFSDSYDHILCLYYDSYRTSCLHETVYFECEGY